MIIDQVIEDHYGPKTAQKYDDIAHDLFWAYTSTLEAISSEVLLSCRKQRDEAPSWRHFLDIGSGTGNVIATLLEHNRLILKTLGQGIPEHELSITEVDNSKHMLKVAQQKLSLFKSVKFNFVEANINDIIHLYPNETFDCIVSAFAIHHLNEFEKKNLFDHLYKILTPGGILVVGDRMPPEDSFNDIHSDYMNVIGANMMKKNCVKSSAPLLSHIVDEILQQFEMDQDKPSSVDKHLEWFKKSGFKKVRNSFFSFGCAVVSGRKCRE